MELNVEGVVDGLQHEHRVGGGPRVHVHVYVDLAAAAAAPALVVEENRGPPAAFPLHRPLDQLEPLREDVRPPPLAFVVVEGDTPGLLLLRCCCYCCCCRERESGRCSQRGAAL